MSTDVSSMAAIQADAEETKVHPLSKLPHVEEPDQFKFEKARYEFCLRAYQSEVERKERLERKAQFYMSFVAAFLGALFLKEGQLSVLAKAINGLRLGPGVVAVIYSTVLVLGAGIITALLAVIRAMALQRYKKGYPLMLVSSLFAPYSEYFDAPTEESIYRANALELALATEFNSKSNALKARWIKRASIGVLVSLICLAVNLGIEAVYLLL
jgi:hypothetical protein